METGHGSGPRQADTAGRVMALMREIALEKGLDALSMRDVAKRAGISLAALQYHYPSKDALLAGFVETMLDGYRGEIGAIRRRTGPAGELRGIVVHAVSQTLDERTGDIFAMLEARSRHDEATARALDGFMQFYLETVLDALVRRHPELPLHEARLAAARVVAVIEGLSSVRAAARAMGLSDDDLCEAAVEMAEAAGAAEKGTLPTGRPSGEAPGG